MYVNKLLAISVAGFNSVSVSCLSKAIKQGTQYPPCLVLEKGDQAGIQSARVRASIKYNTRPYGYLRFNGLTFLRLCDNNRSASRFRPQLSLSPRSRQSPSNLLQLRKAIRDLISCPATGSYQAGLLFIHITDVLPTRDVPFGLNCNPKQTSVRLVLKVGIDKYRSGLATLRRYQEYHWVSFSCISGSLSA